MKDRPERGPLAWPTAVGPDLDALRTLFDPSGSATRIPDVALPDPDLTPASERGEAPPLPEGYVHEGLLGRGAMGEVHRVRDVALNRRMALKVLQLRFQERPASVQRFLDEAQATAQLQHPGIVPVYSLGTLPDGRLYFTMLEVRGRTLGDVILGVHRGSVSGTWGTGPGGTTLRRLVEHLRTAAEAVGHAHRRGVVHRDLKPDNVMVGPHGEVLVMDWGLAKVVGRAELPFDPDDAIRTSRTHETRVGVVFGTPAYMPPEQARGESDRLDARTDVYALGAILFAILHGERPYRGLDSRALLARLAGGQAAPVPESRLPVPEALEAIRRRAMAVDPAASGWRAAAFAQDLVAWLDGSARRARALERVDEARTRQARVETLREQAAGERDQARMLLEQVPAWAPEAHKAPAWAALERAEALEADADLLDVEVEQALQGALVHDPDCVEAHAALAERWRELHAAAERERRPSAARRAEALLRSEVAALPAGSALRRRHARWLEGTARLSLTTAPSGVPVTLERFVPRHRRLVPEPVRALGRTPLRDVELPHGSYRLVLDAPGGVVHLPVRLARGEHVTFAGADGAPRDLPLPRAGELGAGDVFIPEGWCWLGGDPSAIGSLPRRRVWLDGFVLRRTPVTNVEYVAFLDDLVATGREDEALRHVPREKGGTVGEVGAMIFGRRSDGTFVLRPDADGDEWGPQQPVVMVTWHGASAYAAWMARRTGRPWRLPTSDEWEKAGRGVDERIFPWGDALDPSWCCMRDSHRGRPLFAGVDTYPIDESPYGVRGLAGNVRDWCADEVADGRKIDRGGFWLGNAREARLADQHEHVPEHRAAEIGFRLARSLAPASLTPPGR